jgi:hypothetical protein
MNPTPDLCERFGPPAVGKAAVGTEPARRAGWRLVHNHLTVDPVAALLGWDHPPRLRITTDLHLTLFRQAPASGPLPTIVFTFVWAFDLDKDNAFIARVKTMFEARGARGFFVDLRAGFETRLAREGRPLRMALKPFKQDVAASRALLHGLEGQARWFSDGDFPYPAQHLVLDSEALDTAGCASAILAHAPPARG